MAALLVFEFWRQFEIHLGIGILSTIVRWGVFLGFLSWMWRATGDRKKAVAVNTTEVSTQRQGESETQTTGLQKSISTMSDDKYYEQALEEIETGHPVKAVWARAFGDRDGDESKSKALYIKLRVQQERERWQREQNAAAVLADQERAKAEESRRREDLRKSLARASLKAIALANKIRKDPDPSISVLEDLIGELGGYVHEGFFRMTITLNGEKRRYEKSEFRQWVLNDLLPLIPPQA